MAAKAASTATDGFVYYFDYEGDEEKAMEPETKGLLAVFGVCFALGVGGHLMVMVRRCRRGGGGRGAGGGEGGPFQASLAAADLLLLLGALPFVLAARLTGFWSLGTLACKTVNYMLVVGMGTSGLSLLVGGYKRLRICHGSLDSNGFLRRWCPLVVAWLVVGATCVPTAVYTEVKLSWDAGEERPFCRQLTGSDAIAKSYSVVILLLYYVIPVVVTAVLLMIRTPEVKGQDETEACLTKEKLRPEVPRKAVVCACLVMFAACRLPSLVCQLLEAFQTGGPTQVAYYMGVIAQALFFLPCAVNPILLLTMSRPRYLPATSEKQLTQRK